MKGEGGRRMKGEGGRRKEGGGRAKGDEKEGGRRKEGGGRAKGDEKEGGREGERVSKSKGWEGRKRKKACLYSLISRVPLSSLPSLPSFLILELIYKLYRAIQKYAEVYSLIPPPQEPGYKGSSILYTVPVFPFGWTVDTRQHCPSWPHPFPS